MVNSFKSGWILAQLLAVFWISSTNVVTLPPNSTQGTQLGGGGNYRIENVADGLVTFSWKFKHKFLNIRVHYFELVFLGSNNPRGKCLFCYRSGRYLAKFQGAKMDNEENT